MLILHFKEIQVVFEQRAGDEEEKPYLIGLNFRSAGRDNCLRYFKDFGDNNISHSLVKQAQDSGKKLGFAPASEAIKNTLYSEGFDPYSSQPWDINWKEMQANYGQYKQGGVLSLAMTLWFNTVFSVDRQEVLFGGNASAHFNMLNGLLDSYLKTRCTFLTDDDCNQVKALIVEIDKAHRQDSGQRARRHALSFKAYKTTNMMLSGLQNRAQFIDDSVTGKRFLAEVPEKLMSIVNGERISQPAVGIDSFIVPASVGYSKVKKKELDKLTVMYIVDKSI